MAEPLVLLLPFTSVSTPWTFLAVSLALCCTTALGPSPRVTACTTSVFVGRALFRWMGSIAVATGSSGMFSDGINMTLIEAKVTDGGLR